MRERLAAGQRGKNRLDGLCLLHDVAYEKNSESKSRLEADRLLEAGAREIIADPNTGWTERLASRLVAKVMQVKQRMSA